MCFSQCMSRFFLTTIVFCQAFLLPRLGAALVPGSNLIACDRADEVIVLSESSHLDPSCTWTRGVRIVASDVTFDCQGALIASTGGGQGLLITTAVDVGLSNIKVRNCTVEGFLNSLRITREGFRDLAAGEEYEDGTSNIVIENSTFLGSRGTGVFVDGYVTGVTLRNLRIDGAGSAGIYLEAGSKDNVVEDCEVLNNGFIENGPNGQQFEIAGMPFWFWGPGRAGLAIDGSRSNRILNNYFSDNANGGILLYKNCGEFVNQRPERWFHRRYGADDNLIEGNTFDGGRNGVWIGARMGENTTPMDCSDPSYRPGVVLDFAGGNIVRGNIFRDVTFAVRVEDDDSLIEGNDIISVDPAHQAVVVGTRFRTGALGLPVDRTTIRSNHASIVGNGNPFRWVHGHSQTEFASNLSFGRPVGFCEGQQPAVGPFVFVVAFEAFDPENPPVGEPPTLPEPDVLAACPLACANGSDTVVRPRLTIRGLDTPPGDDKLRLSGRVTLAHPFDPPLDPVAHGAGLTIVDTNGTSLVNLVLPAGAYDPSTRIGWRLRRSGVAWTYVDRRESPTAGINRVVLKDRSERQPGRVDFLVKGTSASLDLDGSKLPIRATLIIDQPTAESGQCAHFDGASSGCAIEDGVVRCR